MKEKTNRNITADVIRGFAIITVVLGHCIQQGNGLEYYDNQQFWYNKLYQFIYSFHMPLFMLLAGWFAYYSFKKLEGSRKKQWIYLLKKSVLYVFPIFFWTVFEFVRGYITNKRLGNATTPFSQLLPQFGKYFITNLWFLWAVLICLVIVFMMHFYLRDNIILYAIGFLGLFFITDEMNLGAYKYLMPYYIGAFYSNMYKDKLLNTDLGKKIKSLYEKKIWIYVAVSGVIFAGLFMLYNDVAFIYRSGYRLSRANLIKQAAIDMYRMVIGFVGSGFFIIVWDAIVKSIKNYKWPVMCAFGKNSLGIYILQGYYILLVMVNYTNGFEPCWWKVFLETIIICVISLVSAIIIERVPGVRCLIGKEFFRGKN